jgi:Gram-negative porin
MKNMLTKTALVSSLALMTAGVASAQTTVTGNLDLTYKAISSDVAGAAAKTNSMRTFGKESQINISNKGSLNNGMSYAAGFSLEFDGSDTAVANATNTSTSNSLAGAFNENVYVDFIAGNTTFTIGADHIQNPDYTITNLVGAADPDDLISGINGKYALYSPAKNSAYQAYGFGIIQDFGAAKLSFNYTPDRTTGLANNDTNSFTSTNTTSIYDAGQSAYEIGLRGNFGNKDLDLGIFYNRSANGGEKGVGDTVGGSSSDLIGKMLAASYAFGPAKVAYERAEVTSGTDITTKSDSIGLAYAVNNNLSIGYTYVRTKSDANTGNTVTSSLPNTKEKISQISVGYNLGPVMVGASYAQVSDIGGITTNGDGQALLVRTGVKF